MKVEKWKNKVRKSKLSCVLSQRACGLLLGLQQFCTLVFSAVILNVRNLE